MVIKRIYIENFKGISTPITIDLKPITMLFGPNSSGKSSIIHALHYALEIFLNENLNPDKTIIGGKAVDLGGFVSLVHNHELFRSVKFRFDLDLSETDLPQYYDGFEDIGTFQLSQKPIWEIPTKAVDASVEITIKWSNQYQKPILKRYTVWINKEYLATIETSDDGKQVFLTKINSFNSVFLEDISPDEAKAILERFIIEEKSSDEEFEKLGPIFTALLTSFKVDRGIVGSTEPIGLVGSGSAMPKWGKALEFQGLVWEDSVDQVDQENLLLCLSSLIVGPGEIVRNTIQKIWYLGPIREIPQRNYSPEMSPNLSRWSSGLKAWDILYYAEASFITHLNDWLCHADKFNSGYKVEVKRFREIDENGPISAAISENTGLEELELVLKNLENVPIKSRVTLRDETTGVELMPQDVGVGISQVFPVIISALYNREGIVAIEQPELHIHPALQVSLGDLFVSQINQKDICFLLETHSEHLILRLLRRIRETNENELPPGKWPLNPEQIAVFYIEQGTEGVKVVHIRVDEEGEFLDRWPKGFFSERTDELF